MDKRLNQIQTGSLTDSRLNDDFVYWLKTKGLNYLLILLIAGCAYMGWNWYQRTRDTSRADAWLRLERAGTPQELAVVASEEGGVDSVALIAKVRSASTYIGSILRGVRYDRDPAAEDAKITPELRAEWLENADLLYADIARSLESPSAPPSLTPLAFHALMGRAAVAEARGDLDAARRHLDAAAARATGSYSALAEVARTRGEGLALAINGAELPPRAAVPTGAPPQLINQGTPQAPMSVPPIGGAQGRTLPPGVTPVDPRDTGLVPFGSSPPARPGTSPVPTPPPQGTAPTPPAAPPSGTPAPPPAPPPAP